MKKIILIALLPLFGIANLIAQCTATVSTLNVSCFGGNNGSATVIPSGGLAPYTFLWSTGQITQTVNNLVAGTYTVMVYDADSCSVVVNATILQPTQMSISIVNNNPATCCDGSAIVSVIGGFAPYTYLWSNMYNWYNPSNLCPGYLSVTVTDANGCSMNDITYLSDSNSFQIVVDTLNNINCENNTIGTISVHATGGSGTGYNYYWSGMGITSTLPTLHTNIPGYYCVTATDSDSCTDQACFNITSTYNLYASVISTNANCAISGTAIVSAQGVNPPFTFLWSDSLHQTNDTAVNLSVGIYYVTVTDANGCTVTGFTQIHYSCLNVVKGRVYNDINQNCQQDTGEQGLAGAHLNTNNYSFAITDINGNYTLLTTNLNPTVFCSYQPYTSPICPSTASISVNFSSQGDTSYNNNFGFYIDSSIFDLRVSAYSNNARPGFQHNYYIYFQNASLQSHAAVIRFYYDSALVFSGSTQSGVHYPAQHYIEWQPGILQPNFNSYWINSLQAIFQVPVNVPVGAQLHSICEIQPITGDAYPMNNTFVIDKIVTNSCDPNEKDVYPKGWGADGNITADDSVLHYTLHFQNTGNDTCFTVVIKDTLSPYLNPATVEPGAASHPYTFNLSGLGIITFRFDQILLPDSATNEPLSNGYVNYTIKQKQGNSIGTEIKNTAYIYFDFNEAVITNTTKNTIASPLYIKEKKSGEVSVRVFPNPFSDKTQFTINSEKYKQKYSIHIFDILGKNILTNENILTNRFELSAEGIEQGIYFYKIYCEQQIIASGKLIIE